MDGVLLGFEFTAMASRCELRVGARDAAAAERAAHAAIAEVRRIEAKYSRYRDDSVVARINAAAGLAAVEVDDETAGLLDFGAALHAQSDGRFDLTSGVLRRAWSFTTAQVPTQAALDALLPLVGWQQVRWARPWLALPRAGMQLDLGGIGKEYAVDRAIAVLGAAGVRHALVNLGGDVRALGAAPDGAPWRVGIQHPRGAPGATVATIEAADAAVATSGDYERFFDLDGRRYCHLLDATTGWPVSAQYPGGALQSVSVVGPLCLAAGACATLAMLQPAAAAASFLATQGMQWLAVDAAGAARSSVAGALPSSATAALPSS